MSKFHIIHNRGSVRFQAGVLFIIENAKFWLFCHEFTPFLCTFAGLNNAVVYQYLKSMRYALCSDLTHQAIVHDHIFHLAKNLDVAQLVYGIDCQWWPSFVGYHCR